MAGTTRWINAVMIDCVRITERYEYYLDLVPRLARWGVDMMFWHFTDDQGCALKLRSHPELASRYALSRAQTERLIKLAGRHGIEVVPEVESLGHCRWITHLPRYEHLFEGSATHFNSLCPSHPQTLELLAEVLAETAEVFPSEWLHVGLDEVQFGDCPRCRKRDLPPWRLFAEHAKAVHGIVAGLGKRTILWGDHLVKDPRIARAVPRDCIVAHWDYYIEHPVEADSRKLLDLGFDVLCCPSTARYLTHVSPDGSNLANLRQFARVAHKHRLRYGGAVLGVVNTVWCPERQLGGSPHYGMALGAALAEKPKVDERKLSERFVREEYGIARPASAARALRELHEAAPGLVPLRRVLVEDPGTHGDDPRRAVRPEDVADAEVRRARLAKVRRTLEATRPRVTRRKGEFAMWITAAQILDEELSRFQAWQDAAALEAVRQSALRRGDARGAKSAARDTAAVLREAARGARRSAQLAEGDWKRVRHAADPRRRGRDAYVVQSVALPGLLDRTARVLGRLAARAARVARTGRGRLALPQVLPAGGR